MMHLVKMHTPVFTGCHQLLAHGLWQIFVEARGIEEHQKLPSSQNGDGVIARVANKRMVKELQTETIPIVNVSDIELSLKGFSKSSEPRFHIANVIFADPTIA